MARRNPFGRSLIALLAAPSLLLAALMLKTHTTVAMPPPGQETELSGLSYKAHAFEAKIESVQVELKSGAEAAGVEAEWTFSGSNSDGQMHRVEIETCVMETKTSAEDWKAARSVELVAHWQS